MNRLEVIVDERGRESAPADREGECRNFSSASRARASQRPAAGRRSRSRFAIPAVRSSSDLPELARLARSPPRTPRISFSWTSRRKRRLSGKLASADRDHSREPRRSSPPRGRRQSFPRAPASNATSRRPTPAFLRFCSTAPLPAARKRRISRCGFGSVASDAARDLRTPVPRG